MKANFVNSLGRLAGAALILAALAWAGPAYGQDPLVILPNEQQDITGHLTLKQVWIEGGQLNAVNSNISIMDWQPATGIYVSDGGRFNASNSTITISTLNGGIHVFTGSQFSASKSDISSSGIFQVCNDCQLTALNDSKIHVNEMYIEGNLTLQDSSITTDGRFMVPTGAYEHETWYPSDPVPPIISLKNSSISTPNGLFAIGRNKNLWPGIVNLRPIRLDMTDNSVVSAKDISIYGSSQDHVFNTVNVADSKISASNDFSIDGSNVTATNSDLSAGRDFDAWSSQVTATNSTLSAGRYLAFILGSNITASNSKLTTSGSLLLTRGSRLTANGSELTAGHDITIGASQLTANGSTIDGGRLIDIYAYSQLTAKDNSTIKADEIRLNSAQLTAENSAVTADFVSLWEGGQLTAVGKNAAGKNTVTAGSVVIGNGSTLTLKEGAYFKTTGTQPDSWLQSLAGLSYLRALGPDLYFKAGLAVYSGIYYCESYPGNGYICPGYNSLVRIEGPGVTIDNDRGAVFFRDSTLDVGPYQLTVIGDLTFLNGSIYSLERTEGSIGRSDVDGQVNIAPEANLLITNGAALAINDNNKTVLTATGGVNRLGGSGFKNILYTFDYSDPNAVSLGSRRSSQSVMAGVGGLTNNVINVGGLIDSIAKSNPELGDKLLVALQKIGFALESAPAQAEKALRQLLGEGALHTVNAHHNTVSQVAATLGGRLQTLIGGLPPAAGNGPTENRLWLKPFGQWNRQKDENDVLGYHYNSGGLMLGYDREMALPGLTLGLYGSLAHGDLENDLAKTSIRTAGLGLYSLYEFGQYFVDVDLGYNRSDNHASMNVSPVFGGGYKTGDFHSDSFQAGLNFGRAFQVLETASLTPSAGLRYTRVKQKGWTEKSPNDDVILNWFGDSRENFVEIPLNLKLASAFKTKGGATVAPELRLGGIIAANHPKAELRLGFVGSDESTTISGIEPGRSRLVTGAGLKAQLSEATDVFINYDLEARRGYQGHSASAGLGISF